MLLRRNIAVVAQMSMQYVVGAAVAGVLLAIVAVMAIYVVREHPHRARELVLSFLRREMLLAYKIMMELLDISGDSTCPTLASTAAVFAYCLGVCSFYSCNIFHF